MITATSVTNGTPSRTREGSAFLYFIFRAYESSGRITICIDELHHSQGFEHQADTAVRHQNHVPGTTSLARPVASRNTTRKRSPRGE